MSYENSAGCFCVMSECANPHLNTDVYCRSCQPGYRSLDPFAVLLLIAHRRRELCDSPFAKGFFRPDWMDAEEEFLDRMESDYQERGLDLHRQQREEMRLKAEKKKQEKKDKREREMALLKELQAKYEPVKLATKDDLLPMERTLDL